MYTTFLYVSYPCVYQGTKLIRLRPVGEDYGNDHFSDTSKDFFSKLCVIKAQHVHTGFGDLDLILKSQPRRYIANVVCLL